MGRIELYRQLVRCKRPCEFFGAISDEEALKREYHRYMKLLHPDLAPAAEQYIAGEAAKQLNELYRCGKEELEEGSFGNVGSAPLYRNMEPLFTFVLHRKRYDFYEYAFEGEVASIYKGLRGANVVYLKHTREEGDNRLLDTEFNNLSGIAHIQLPTVREKLSINDRNAFIIDEVEGIMLTELMQQYPAEIPGEHIMWILERLLSVIGYLHFNKIVHGNLTPENVLLNKANHKVSLVGFSSHIPEADAPGAQYKTRPALYAAPEIKRMPW